MSCEWVDSNLILNAQKKQWQNQTIELIILFGFSHHSRKQCPQILQKVFLHLSTYIFQSLIDYIKFSTEKQWKLVTAVCKICPKYKKTIIAILHQHSVTNWHYVTVVWQAENGRKS